MTSALIADWTEELEKFRREKIMRDTQQHLAASNILCERVIQEFLYLN